MSLLNIVAATVTVTISDLTNHSQALRLCISGHWTIAINYPQESFREERKTIKSANKVIEMQPAPGGFCGQKLFWELFV